jgi:uncharacterized protein YbjT (DUF2867 family)
MTTNGTHTHPVLVLGATGKTGRRVTERLRALGVPVRAGSRAADPPFDWEDRSTWASALDGMAAVYVSYFPDLAVPGAADAVRALSAQAVEQGVRRLVLISGRGEEEAQRAEQIVMASGVAEWTIVRCAFFAQNFSESFFLEPVLAGEVVLPAGEVPEPFVDADDIADVAVAALTQDGHAGEVYELTGPRALTFRDAVGEIARATGREIGYRQVSVEDYTAELARYGEPPDVVELIGYVFGEVLDGRNVNTTDGVRRALGRAPRDFADYARETAATGVWNRAAA